ncbi:hypothetical protein [Spirochaeta africana]|uniref:Uncharacterized protein n=1 Tax=Spirochaeta africana (strain ATCC 700263 / DSM 8902 / Z-7692) TaxID=889378 RepID=H9UMW6_SPIAZ|nr:hypothetical protein [Spirochaeta africana]AFG38859.1 hypothetical protein Spiaf_2835 [Spirochaeta africana DSM 8902]
MKPPIYSYNRRAVESRLVQAFRKRGREATVADLIAATGLPRLQIEETLPQVVRDYRGHLRVTESGEILYHFPHGVHHRERSPRARAARLLRRIGRGAAAVGKLVFKLWIMLMLVGYFVLFVALVIAALMASLAASAKSEGRSRGRSIGGTYMMTRLIQQVFWLWMFSGRRRGYGYRGAAIGSGIGGSRTRSNGLDWSASRSEGDGPPLHQSVFAFVFGSDDPAREWETRERQAFVELVQTHKGVVTLDELRAMSGRSLDEAHDLMNRMLLEYDGEPDVTEQGSLIYRFPELLRTAEPSDRRGGRIDRLLPAMPTVPFNDNSPGLNRWIGVLNGVNLGFGAYFTGFGLAGGLPEEGFGLFYSIVVVLFSEIAANPLGLVLIGLGVVPLVFSLLFYLIPVLRWRIVSQRNTRIARRNARQDVLQGLMAAATTGTAEVDPHAIVRGTEDRDEIRLRLEVLNEIAAELQADIEAEEAPEAGSAEFAANLAGGAAHDRLRYRFPDLVRQQADVQRLREGINPDDYRTGKVVFDSNE